MERISTLIYRDCCPLLLVEVGGGFQEADIPEMVSEACEACRQGRYQAALIDARLQSAPSFESTDYALLRYRISTAIARSWCSSIPLAIVVSADSFVPDYLFQTICSFHGVRARDFCDIDQARAWLGSFVPVIHPSLSLLARA